MPEAWSYGAYPGKTLFGRFVIFPTLERGWDGLHQWMVKRQNMTVRGYAEAHAPSTEPGNDPARYARILVKYALGIQGEAQQNAAAQSTTINKLLEAGWPDKLKKAFNEAEGYTTGDELGFDDPSLPPDVGPLYVLAVLHPDRKISALGEGRTAKPCMPFAAGQVTAFNP